MVFIGISGKRGSGKSLLASYLEHYHGFERFSLADELKKEVMRDWKLSPKQLWGDEKEVPTHYLRDTGGGYLTPRDIMIRHGMYRRSIDNLYFCKYFDERCADKVVCDDLRFLNELDYFKKRFGAKFIRIERKQELNVFKGALDDLSENQLDTIRDWDWKLPEERNIEPNDLRTFADYIALHV